MPYKDLEVRKAYHGAYRLSMSPEQVARKKETDAAWWSTDRGKYASHRNRAKRMKIPFTISFEDWLAIWLDSGHYEERSPTGYVMSRRGDEGPYSKDNVFIQSAGDNKREAFFNNKMSTPTGLFYKDL